MSQPYLNILIADDDPEDIELMEEHILLVAPTAKVDKFLDGRSAYEYLRSQSSDRLPSLIVLDYNMPGISGSQLLSLLKPLTLYRSIPKIVLSSSSTKRYRDESIKNGASEYFVKPDNMQAVSDLAKKLVSLAVKSP